MPYKLRKAPNKPLYWVITIETGKKHSKLPIPMEKAKAQMRILESALTGGTGRREVIQLELERLLRETPPGDPEDYKGEGRGAMCGRCGLPR